MKTMSAATVTRMLNDLAHIDLLLTVAMTDKAIPLEPWAKILEAQTSAVSLHLRLQYFAISALEVEAPGEAERMERALNEIVEGARIEARTGRIALATHN